MRGPLYLGTQTLTRREGITRPSMVVPVPWVACKSGKTHRIGELWDSLAEVAGVGVTIHSCLQLLGYPRNTASWLVRPKVRAE